MTVQLSSVDREHSSLDVMHPQATIQHDFFRDPSAAANGDRSASAQVRNPLLSLPVIEEFRQLPDLPKNLLRRLLCELSLQARARAKQCWMKRKAPMACYWWAVSVYARHLARALAR